MINSMTGYGRASATLDEMSITIELRSVNHRYFEFYSRMPRAYLFLEEHLKKAVHEKVSRGKVDCSLQIAMLTETPIILQVDKSLAKNYVQMYDEVADELGVRNDISVSRLLSYSDVLTLKKEEADEEALLEAVIPVLSEAITAFIEMRKVEGEKMKEDILNRCDSILESIQYIEVRAPETVKLYEERLNKKMREILDTTHIDEQRILAEAAIYADKVDVSEETVRMHSHIQQLQNFLSLEEPVGRKIDFLVQEMNRETNTIGSKSQDVTIANKVIELKADIEKIREQVQNIE